MRLVCLGISSIALVGLAACSASDPIVDGDGRVLRTETDRFGLITCSEATETETCYTHRAIVGVSMGAGGAGQLGLTRPELAVLLSHSKLVLQEAIEQSALAADDEVSSN